MSRLALHFQMGLLLASVASAQDFEPLEIRVGTPVQPDSGERIVVPFYSVEGFVYPQPVAVPGQPPLAVPTPTPTPAPVPAPIRRSKPRMVPTLPKEFEARDKNHDGQIGMYEWERSKYSEFLKLDKNRDGFLTPQELNPKASAFASRSRSDNVLPSPGNLTSYNQKIGESFTFSVTGRTNGPVWGTGTYTTDSDLATVAVHAGLLKEGEQGTVTVTIVESPNQFAATTANGVTSGSWQSYPAAYTVR